MMSKIASMLMELKDTSEMMIDLAYSSLLYDNTEIAEEVIALSDTLAIPQTPLLTTSRMPALFPTISRAFPRGYRTRSHRPGRPCRTKWRGPSSP